MLEERLGTADLHQVVLDALGPGVLWSSPVDGKPLDVDLRPPLPSRLRIYIYNATRPPGGRPAGEHKIQVIVPGQGRGERGNFDLSGDRIVLLMGFVPQERVFVLWDSSAYRDFAWSRNVQVASATVITALAGDIGEQQRRIAGTSVPETVVAARWDHLAEGIRRRLDLTARRLTEV